MGIRTQQGLAPAAAREAAVAATKVQAAQRGKAARQMVRSRLRDSQPAEPRGWEDDNVGDMFDYSFPVDDPDPIRELIGKSQPIDQLRGCHLVMPHVRG